MNFVLAFFFSCVDFASIFLYTMTVFDIPIKENKTKFIIGIIFCSLFSHVLLKLGLLQYTLWLQIPAVFLIFRFSFKESGIYALWITVLGYVTPLLIQMSLIYGFLKSGLMTYEDVAPYTITGYAIQSSTFVLVLIISLYCVKFGERFSFNFANVFGLKKTKSPSILYVFTAIVIFIVVSVAYPSYYGKSIDHSFYMSLTLTILSFIVMIGLSFLREIDESNNNYIPTRR